MQWLADNWGSVVGVIGTILGIIGVFLTVKSWKRKIPRYVIHSNNIFKGLEHTIPDVEVKFAGYGQPVTSLTITKIGFWNDGNETIKKQDVVKDDPITIRAKGDVIILSATILESVNPLNNIECTLSRDRMSVAFTFDYLDKNQGAIIQVFHTGTSNADITMAGTIMGTFAIRRISQNQSDKRKLPSTRIIVLGTICGVVTNLIFATFTLSSSAESPDETFHTVLASAIVLSAMILAGLFYAYLTFIPKPFSKVFS